MASGVKARYQCVECGKDYPSEQDAINCVSAHVQGYREKYEQWRAALEPLVGKRLTWYAQHDSRSRYQPMVVTAIRLHAPPVNEYGSCRSGVGKGPLPRLLVETSNGERHLVGPYHVSASPGMGEYFERDWEAWRSGEQKSRAMLVGNPEDTVLPW